MDYGVVFWQLLRGAVGDTLTVHAYERDGVCAATIGSKGLPTFAVLLRDVKSAVVEDQLPSQGVMMLLHDDRALEGSAEAVLVSACMTELRRCPMPSIPSVSIPADLLRAVLDGIVGDKVMLGVKRAGVTLQDADDLDTLVVIPGEHVSEEEVIKPVRINGVEMPEGSTLGKMCPKTFGPGTTLEELGAEEESPVSQTAGYCALIRGDTEPPILDEESGLTIAEAEEIMGGPLEVSEEEEELGQEEEL